MSRQQQTASLIYEQTLTASGYACIVGFDEAGRGAWAGPVAAAAVLLPSGRADLSRVMRGVRDSKLMTPRARLRLADIIRHTARTWGVGSASPAEIDALGIVPATHVAMMRAWEQARAHAADTLVPDMLLLDAIQFPQMSHVQQCPLIRGDQKSLTIAAASVLAKVWRDGYMLSLDHDYPDYGFGTHKGYGTARHSAALRAHGVTPHHRTTFKPVYVLLTDPTKGSPS